MGTSIQPPVAALRPSTQKEAITKGILRTCWRSALLTHTLLIAALPRNFSSPKIFYGGARSGNVGGPLVKVMRLQNYFPQHIWDYNLAYILSNAPYMPALALDCLRLKGIPVVLNQNGVFYPGWFAGNWCKQNEIMANVYHRANYVFWQSMFCRRAADRFFGMRQGEGEILYNAVDLDLFAPSTDLDVSGSSFNFLLTGKISKHRNYRLASILAGLEIARKRGLEASLTIAGWVEDINALRLNIESHGLEGHVIIRGSYTQEEAPYIYQAADAYVTMNFQDPCPNAVIEALSCGLPVLYSASGGVPELVGDEAGVGLSVPEDWEAIHVPSSSDIAEGMLLIAENREKMSWAARQRAVRKFGIQHWIDRHSSIFYNLLKDR